MKYVEIIADSGSSDTVLAIAKKEGVQDIRLSVVEEDGMQKMRMLVSDDKLQLVLDALQNLLTKQPSTRIVVLPVDVSLPKPEEEERKQEDAATEAREALYEEVEKGVRLDLNFVVLVILSSLVAAIGLITNNVAVVIGAMVIAPLLGPNLALSFATAMGDFSLIKKSVQTLVAGILLAVAVSGILGMFWPFDVENHELMLRTVVGIDSATLALASGAAAALSLTTGLSSVLVGVMVAVALLPPAAALGLMLGSGNTVLATGAGLLLVVNIVCVNLASKIVFDVKGIRPPGWREEEKAKRTKVVYILGWLVTLFLLIALIYVRRSLTS
ncbi:TIGR00341 family protein [Sulfurimonas sp.]|uniref:TIGR00341 family protein n=1 Tax=Sulfurimonas sp. TaxID=2022749 RepID=UPI00356546A4